SLEVVSAGPSGKNSLYLRSHDHPDDAVRATAREDRDPKEPRAPRPWVEGDARLPEPRDRREVLRPDHLHGLPDVLLRAGPGRDLPARRRWRLRPAQDAEADQLGHRIGPRFDH